jgi:polysaccharide export outer membrane protein
MKILKPKISLVCALGLAWLIFLLSSCGNTRQLTYMQGKFDTAGLDTIKFSEPVIRQGDLLNIIVYSDNPAATALFNQPLITVANSGGGGGGTGGGGGGESGAGSGGTGSTSGTLTSGSPTSPGYLVDENGNIEFQGIGILHVKGMTKSVLRDTLGIRLAPYLNHPYFTIRYMNYRFTMLGEVTHPGIFGIPGEHISLLEAIGLAGDLTFFGRRDNVLIIRENNGIRQWARLDLTKPEIMGSPYFYLQQNDVVYVEANKKKIVANDQTATRNVTIAATIISTLAIVYSILK